MTESPRYEPSVRPFVRVRHAWWVLCNELRVFQSGTPTMCGWQQHRILRGLGNNSIIPAESCICTEATERSPMDQFRTHTNLEQLRWPLQCNSYFSPPPSYSVNANIDTDNKMTFASDKRFGLVDSSRETWRRIQQYAETGKFQESSPPMRVPSRTSVCGDSFVM